MKKIWIIVISVVLAGGIIGGSTYAFSHNKAEKEKKDLQTKIDEANKKIADLTAQISTVSDVTSTTTSDTNTTNTATASNPTAGWKTYTDSANKVSFKYPSPWIATNIKSPDLAVKAQEFKLSSDNAETDLPSILSFSVYSKASDLDTKKIGTTNLKSYLDKYSSQSDPLIQNMKPYKIGPLNGYKADAGPNTFGGGTYYYLENNNAVYVWVFSARDGSSGTTTEKELLLGSVTIL